MSHTEKTAPYRINHMSARRAIVREECKRFTRQERRRLRRWIQLEDEGIPDPIRRAYRNGYCGQGCCY